jgi:membrane protease YdiL (CAAX protease family)
MPTTDEHQPIWDDPYRPPQDSAPPIRLPEQTRPIVPWGVFDVIVVAVVYLAGTILGRSVAAHALGISGGDSSQLTSHQWLMLILGAGIGSLAGAALAIGWLRYAARATWADLGVTCAAWPSQVLTGLKSFLLLMLPIFGLQWTLNLFYERFVGKPPQHPLIEHLLEHPGGLAFAIAAFTAVVVAPLTEEFLFRAVLQGWLERLVGLIPGSSPREARLLLYVPILVSSAVFAGMHHEHGVAWVPLFFFGLALGYLYQRTRNLIAPIVLHMSLNASSMLMLWLFSISQGAA